MIANAVFDIARYHHQIDDFTHVISVWQQQANLQLIFIFVVIVCGAAITVLQGITQGWSKNTVRVLAASTTVLTAINAQIFTADYRLLKQTAIDAGDLVEQLNFIAENLTRSDADVPGLQEQWIRTVTQFRGLQRSVLQGARASSSTAAFSVYAAGPPAWIVAPPKDNFNLFFVGTADNPSIAAAEQQSFQNAVEAGVRALAGSNTARAATLRRILNASAARQSNYFSYDQARHSYHYAILIRVTKDVAK